MRNPMSDLPRKTKPELYEEIWQLKRRLDLLEQFLLKKHLFTEASQFVEEKLEELDELEDLPF